jgi:small subunit ribosomal protein S7
MPRRARVFKRETFPEAKYNNATLAKLINKIMKRGKKSTAESIIYDALDIIEQRGAKSPVGVVEQAVRNATPLLEVKPRRVGGATYQVPIEVRPERGTSLALRWLLKSAGDRAGKSMAEKLAAEFIDASNEQGATIKKRDDTHKMAEANRAFAHYRW